MKRILIYLTTFVLVACSSTPQKQTQGINKSFDSTLVKPYINLLPSSSEQVRKFIKELVNTVSSFYDRPLDTTILIIGLIDNDNLNDTITSRVFVDNDTVLVRSAWKRKREILWQNELKNPYLWISDNELFEPKKRSIWVTFTIGYKHAIPRLFKLSDHRDLIYLAVKTGIRDLENKGFHLREESYKQYIETFNGSIIEWDDPEIHPRYIWYEPLKRFVLFFVG